MVVPRSRNPFLCLALAATLTSATASAQNPSQDRMAPGPPHESNVVVGELPPTAFALTSIDGERFDLATARGEKPLLVLFFRGVW